MKTSATAGKFVGLSLAIALLAWVIYSSGYFGSEETDEAVKNPLTVSNAAAALENAFSRTDWPDVESACRVLLDQDPFHAEARFNLGFSLYKQDRLDEAAEHYLQSKDFAEFRDYSLFNLACIDARQNKPEQAIEYLKEALENGFASSLGIENNQDLKSLGDHPQFEQLVIMENQNRGTRRDAQGN